MIEDIISTFRDASLSILVLSAGKMVLFITALYLYFSGFVYVEEIGIMTRFKRAGVIAVVSFIVITALFTTLHYY